MPPEFPSGTTDITQLIQDIKETFQFLISPQFQEKLLGLKVIFILVSILFLGGIIYFLLKTDYLKDAFLDNMEDLFVFKDFGVKKWERKWRRIKKRFEKGTESQQKLSLIEGDKMLDDILKRSGYGGENLAERLEKLTEDDVSNLNQVLEAVQVCQDIARDPDYRLSKERAEEILNIFERALKDLQVL